LLAIISAPIMGWLERHGSPSKVALLLGWIVGQILLIDASALLTQIAQPIHDRTLRVCVKDSRDDGAGESTGRP